MAHLIGPTGRDSGTNEVAGVFPEAGCCRRHRSPSPFVPSWTMQQYARTVLTSLHPADYRLARCRMVSDTWRASLRAQQAMTLRIPRSQLGSGPAEESKAAGQTGDPDDTGFDPRKTVSAIAATGLSPRAAMCA